MHKSLFQIALEFCRCYHNNRDIGEHAKIECVRSKDRYILEIWNTIQNSIFSRPTFFERILFELLCKLFFMNIVYKDAKLQIFQFNFSKGLLILSFFLEILFFFLNNFSLTCCRIITKRRNAQLANKRIAISRPRLFSTMLSSLLKRDIFIIIKPFVDQWNRRPKRTESRNTITSERQVTTHYNTATIIYRNLRRKISPEISIKLLTIFKR